MLGLYKRKSKVCRFGNNSEKLGSCRIKCRDFQPNSFPFKQLVRLLISSSIVASSILRTLEGAF